MVLHPFEQPRGHARHRLPGNTAPFASHHDARLNQPSSRIKRSIDSIDSRLVRTSNEEITSTTPERLNSSRINITVLSLQERRNRQWCDHVSKLKFGTKEQPSITPKERKPFGKFSKIVVTGTQPLVPIAPPEVPDKRRVRFNVDASSKELSRSMGQGSIDTSSSTSSNSKKISLDGNFSSHRCSRVKVSDFSRHSFERLFWSRGEVKRIRAEAHSKAESFRTKHPATAKQVGILFEDVCKNDSSNTSSRSIAEEEAAEDNEEILRSFLHDWAASDVRGLEEDITGRSVFLETRRMGVQGILAYQESLREQARLARYQESCSLDSTHMAELIRARSESTSQRSRMFAMYMALGDALVVSSTDMY